MGPQYTSIKDKIFEYVDTQLRYNNSYEYEILVNNVVIGSKYKFIEFNGCSFDTGEIRENRVEY